MPRLRLPKNSMLRDVIDEGHDFWSDSCGRQLLCIALVAMYTPDYSDRIELYHRHKNNVAGFLRACADGEILPCRNQEQETINQLCPRSTEQHLYVPARDSKIPTHYVSLIRDTKSGLWRLRSPRVYELYSPKQPPRDGILAHWKAKYTPLPNHACGLSIHFRRMLTGGQGILEMIEEIQESYELRRQLTLCAVVCELFGCFKNERLTVRVSPGKVVFRSMKPDTDNSSPTYITPLEFEPETINPYARKVEKPNVIIWGNASAESLYVSKNSRSIQPQIRYAQEYPLESKAYQFLKDVLLSRLLPVIGVASRGKVDIIGISYNPDEKETIVTDYALQRESSAFSTIPQFYLDKEEKLWVPNNTAVAVLKTLALEHMPNHCTAHEAHEERKRWLERVFKWLGATGPDDYPGLFEFWGQPLHPEKREPGIRRRLRLSVGTCT